MTMKVVDTEFDKFTELKNIFVELVVVDDREDGLIESLQLLYVVARYITQLDDAAAAIKAIISTLTPASTLNSTE